MTTAGIVTSIITAIISGLGGAGLWQYLSQRRTTALAEKQDERAADQDSVDIVNSWREQAKASAHDAAEARSEARKARDELESMRLDIAALLDRVEHLERVEGDLTRLAGFVVLVKAGVEQGIIPPWPSEPPHVVALMSQVKREDTNGT